MSVSEKRFEQIDRLVKLGPRNAPAITRWNDLIVPGRPNWRGVSMDRSEKMKSLLVRRNPDTYELEIVVFCPLKSPDGTEQIWRPMQPRLISLIELVLWGQI